MRTLRLSGTELKVTSKGGTFTWEHGEYTIPYDEKYFRTAHKVDEDGSHFINLLSKNQSSKLSLTISYPGGELTVNDSKLQVSITTDMEAVNSLGDLA